MKHFRTGLLLITLLFLAVFMGCTPLEAANSPRSDGFNLPPSIEVIATLSDAHADALQTAFSGVPVSIRREVDCPDMEIVKVQARTTLEMSTVVQGLSQLSGKILFTRDCRYFTAITTWDFPRPASSAWFPLTFVEVCELLKEGAFLVTEYQHYIQFE